MITLLENQTSNTDGNQITGSYEPKSMMGTVAVIVEGTFDGATASVECRHPAGGDWVPIGDEMEFTTAGISLLELPLNMGLRGAVSSAGASTDITMRVV